MQRADQNCAVTFFFCDYKNTESQLPINILKSIASQMARQSQQCFNKLTTYYECCNPINSFVQMPKVNELHILIQDMAQEFESVALIVDGLDECGDLTVEVVERLVKLSTASPKVKTLFQSRDELHIRDLLHNYDQISIAARSHDLKLYVASQIELRIQTKRLRLRSEKLKEHIMDRLINGADGM